MENKLATMKNVLFEYKTKHVHSEKSGKHEKCVYFEV